MNKVTVKIKKLENYDENLPLPSYETIGSAGADIRASLMPEKTICLEPGQRKLIPTGLSMEIPQGFEIQVRPRSGMSFKTSLMVLNAPGTVDSDYRGEVKIIMGNLGSEVQEILHGDRVAQIVLAPVTQAEFEITETLTPTERGAGGFGSTGKS